MKEQSNKKRILVTIFVILVFLLFLLLACKYSTRERYLSNDPFYGTFNVSSEFAENGNLQKSYPADFLISVDTDTWDEVLLKHAEESGVDTSSESWVYCFSEEKMFHADKIDDEMLVLENGEQIAEFHLEPKKLLFVTYDFDYYVEWRGQKYNLIRTLQGFAFPIKYKVN